MLFRNRFLELIKEGKLQTAFRKWTKPTIKEGGTLLTPVGQLTINSLRIIDYKKISDKDLMNAGYESRKEFDKELNFKKEGQLYKIEFIVERDPRIKLREQNKISAAEFDELIEKLQRIDRSGPIKDWTIQILKAVAVNPQLRAIDYANQLGFEKEWFKLNIRKLKNMGLTISLTNGYEISPRGKTLLEIVGNRQLVHIKTKKLK